MKIINQAVFFILSILLFAPWAYAADEIILGIYSENLTYYEKSGKKLGQFTKITDADIRNTPVIETSPRNLKLIKFRGKKAWVRASQLKLSINTSAICPDAAPGQATDRATPVSSGMGAECIKK